MHFNKLSILNMSGGEICEEKYRKYFFWFVPKYVILKLACVLF